MASRRFGARDTDSRYTDLGASYFTVTDDAFGRVVNDWQRVKLARQWTDTFAVWQDGELATKQGPMRWASGLGLRALVTDLASGLEVRYGVHVESVTEGAVDGEPFDRVILAMPDPQALAVLALPLVEERSAIADRHWDASLVLAARWSRRYWDWDGVFVHGSDVIEWIADDGSRRGDGAPVLTAHSTAAFAATRLAVPADAADELVAALAPLGIPAPEEVLRVQRWTYAKPVGTREPLFFLSSKGIGFCGDGWGRSRIEGAWLSGTALGHALSLPSPSRSAARHLMAVLPW
jgi:renalase